MPVYYVLKDVWLPVIPSYAVRVAIESAICLPGLALCSEAIRGALKPADLRGVDGRESKGGSPGDRCPRRGDGRVGGEGFVP